MQNKLKFEQIRKDEKASFRYLWSSVHHRDEISLHFHPELEISYIEKGSGYRMTGDFLEPYVQGELLLFPSGVPHCWIHNPESCLPDGHRKGYFVQFAPELLETGVSFFSEWEYAAHRLLSIQQAVKFTGQTAERIIRIIEEMSAQSPDERLLSLLRLLYIAGTTTELIPIGVQGDAVSSITKNMKRTQLIFKYVIEHYKEKVSLAEIAGIVSMTPTAFCAFFKRETGKTFNSFINEYRIEIASNLLKNFPDREISEIAWQCGFNDIPYFNRYFKKLKGLSPGEWRKEN